MRDWHKSYDDAVDGEKLQRSAEQEEVNRLEKTRAQKERQRLAKIPGTPEYRDEQKNLADEANHEKYSKRFKCCIKGCPSIALAEEITIMAGDSDYYGTQWGPHIVHTGNYKWDKPPEGYKVCIKCRRVYCRDHATENYFHENNSTCFVCAKEELRSGRIVLARDFQVQTHTIQSESVKDKSHSPLTAFLILAFVFLILAVCGVITVGGLFAAWLYMLML